MQLAMMGSTVNCKFRQFLSIKGCGFNQSGGSRSKELSIGILMVAIEFVVTAKPEFR